MLIRKIKTFFKKNKFQLIILLIHRSFLSPYVKKLLKIAHAKLVRSRANLAGKVILNNHEEQTLIEFRKNGHVDVSSYFTQIEMVQLESKTLELEQMNAQRSSSSDHKKFWSRMTDKDADNKQVSNITNKIALNNSILKILHQYFSAPAFMEYSIITKSIYTGEKLQIYLYR